MKDGQEVVRQQRMQMMGLVDTRNALVGGLSSQGGFCFQSHKAVFWYNAIPDELISSFSQKGAGATSKGTPVAVQSRDWHTKVQAGFLLSLGPRD